MNKQLRFDFLLDKTSKVSAKDEIDFDVNITVIDSPCMQLPILDRQAFAAWVGNRTCRLVLCKAFYLSMHTSSHLVIVDQVMLYHPPPTNQHLPPTTRHPPTNNALKPRDELFLGPCLLDIFVVKSRFLFKDTICEQTNYPCLYDSFKLISNLTLIKDSNPPPKFIFCSPVER